MRCCKSCESRSTHECWRDGHVVVQETGPVVPDVKDVPYREYLCGRCGETFRVPRCEKCGGPALRVKREAEMEVVASAEMELCGVRRKDGSTCRLVFFEVGIRGGPLHHRPPHMRREQGL